MEKKTTRRKFLIQTTAATAAAHAWAPSVGFGEELHADSVQSTSPQSKSGSLENVARNRAAYQSSSADEDHTAHLAPEGSEQTYWECEPGGEQWISVDLGKIQPITRATLHWGDTHPQSYRIEVFSDGLRPQNWTSVYATKDGSGSVEDAT